MNVQNAMGFAGRRKIDFRKVHRTRGRTGLNKADQRSRHFFSDVGLCFLGRTADVRREDHVREPLQLDLKVLGIGFGFVREYVNRGAGEVFRLECLGQGGYVDHRSPAGVDEIRASFHHLQLGAVDHHMGQRGCGNVKRDKIAFLKNVLKSAADFGISAGELGDDVIEDDSHSHGLGESRDLGPDVSVSDDPERFAAHFVAPG